MPIKLEDLAKEIEPKKTVLLFGSGSSIPSGALPVTALINQYSKAFDVKNNNYTLSEITGICEEKKSRRQVIKFLRELYMGLTSTGGLNNLPLFPWKSIFTTNYDTLIEQAYTKKGKKYEYITRIFVSPQEMILRMLSYLKSMVQLIMIYVMGTHQGLFFLKQTMSKLKSIEKTFTID